MARAFCDIKDTLAPLDIEASSARWQATSVRDHRGLKAERRKSQSARMWAAVPAEPELPHSVSASLNVAAGAKDRRGTTGQSRLFVPLAAPYGVA